MRKDKYIIVVFILACISIHAEQPKRELVPCIDIYGSDEPAVKYPDYRINPKKTLYYLDINDNAALIMYNKAKDEDEYLGNYLDSVYFTLITKTTISIRKYQVTCRSNKIFPFKISEVFKEQLSSGISLSDIEDVRIYTIIKWRTVEHDDCDIFLQDTEATQDTLVFGIGKYGVNFLFDFSALKKEYETFEGKGSTFFVGLLKNFAYTDVGIACLNGKETAQPILATPIVTINQRNRFLNNISAEVFIMPESDDITTVSGYGLGIGLLGNPKIIKTGWVRYDDGNGKKNGWVAAINLTGVFKTDWSNFWGYAMPRFRKRR